MKKKVLYIETILCMILLYIIIGCFTNKTNANYADNGNVKWYYQVRNGKATNCYVSSYTDSIENLELPLSLGGYEVQSFNYNWNLGNSSTKSFSMSGESNYYSVEDGILYSKDMKILYKCPAGKEMSGEYNIPSTVTSINSNAFSNCKKVASNIIFPEGLLTIGSNAFQNSGITGNLNIPGSVSSIGSYAFSGCNGLNGIVSVGNGVNTISIGTFENCENVTKFKLGNSVRSLSITSFPRDIDIWIDNIEGQVSINDRFGGGHIHWKDETHKLTISTVPGVKLVNNETNEELMSGDYLCETAFSYKVVVEPGYNYSDLKILEINNNDSDRAVSYEIDTNATYEFSPLIHDRGIYIQSVSNESDLALRAFITEVNRQDVVNSRYPVVGLYNGRLSYLHTKYPITVKNGNSVTYKIRAYNEGLSEGVAEKISVYLPEGLKFDDQNKTNTGNGWFVDGENKISTTITSNKVIKPYSGNLNPDYIDVDLYLIVAKSADDIQGQDIRLNMIAEIASQKPGDSDSTPGSIKSAIPEDYKDEEVLNSNSSSYIRGTEDDDDFESVSIQGKVKIEYNIKINKIDTDTKELLQGAKFDLIKDEEIVATATTDENGVLDFGTLTTYGEGEDVYYIAETEAPAGYMPVEKNRIKITVIKTILDEEKGTYSVKVLCELLDYKVDTTRYEYTPIETVDQFMQIGTGNVVTIDGVDYHYNTDTNYKLMADLDLNGIQWTPINRNLKSIIDGNNHKISNLTITPSGELDISEVGLFGTFSGIIQNLELENVNINVNTFAKGATSTSGYTGVGALVGVMKNGYIINCKVSGNIIAKENNVGGFIGHTLKGNMVKVQNSTNNATIASIKSGKTDSKYQSIGGTNVGGAIGCALGAISVTDTINNGTIHADTYNAGGLVGYAEATEYQDVNINADFDEGDKTIDLVVENKNTAGQYNLELENIDGSTLGLIKGAVYKVLDENRQVISGLENVALDEGHLKLATVDIQTLGVDTYYIQEITPAQGYDPLGTNIKLNIRRYWDGTEAKFKVSVEKDNVDYGDLDNERPDETENTLPSKTNQVFSKVVFENVSWNSNKAEFKGCTNTGNITCSTTNAAGIIGNSHCIVTIDSCVNNGEIDSTSKAGGIISELKTDETKIFSSIVNSENTGKVISASQLGPNGTGSSGGIIAHAIAYINVQNCTNRGEILAYGGQAASGIVADLIGELKAKGCTNYGMIHANGMNPSYANVNSVAGGIVGKNINVPYPQHAYTKDDNVLIIDSCNNYGNIIASCHLGGIIGLSTACYIDVNNCEVKGLEEIDGVKQAVSIIDEVTGDKGGIIGNCSTERISVTNCTVDNVDLHRLNPIKNTYGGTGGIIGEFNVSYGYGTTTIQSINVSNCNVSSTKIKCYDKETAGIIGNIIGSGSITKTNINDCTVRNCEILNDHATSSYSSAAGILASSDKGGSFTIKDCIVDNCNIKTSIAEGGSSLDMNTAGIYGMASEVSNVLIQDCDVINNTSIINNAAKGDSCANAAGIMCEIHPDNNNGKFEILNCNVRESSVTTTAGNLSGILSVIANGSTSKNRIEGCSLDKVELTSETWQAACSSNSNTAGVIAYADKPMEIKDISVTNSNLVGDGKNTAGIVGYGYRALEINDILVDHTNITGTVLQETSSSSRSCDCVSAVVGGVGDKLALNNVRVNESNIVSENAANTAGLLGSSNNSEIVKLTNCVVENSNIESKLDYGTCNNTSNLTSAGMVGRATSAKINNCKVLDTDVIGKGNIVAGVIATTDNITANNVEVRNINIKAMPEAAISNQYATRSVAGLIGSSSITAKFKDITLTNIDIDSRIETVGGLIGYGNGFELDGCTADNLDIHYEVHTPNTYGSIAGIGSSINEVNSTIKNVSVKNSSIEADGTKVAGLFGTFKSQASLDNCNVENTSLKNNGKYFIVDTFANNAKYNGGIGGLVAYADSDLTINNSAIKNSTITGQTEETIDYQHVGGILGYSHGDSTFNNVKVIKTKINNNTPSGITGGIVGMTHNLDGETPVIKKLTISSSSVDGDTIINGTTHVGGILGFGKLIANNNNIKNTTITSTSSFGDAGGFIGNSKTGTIINGGIVDNLNVTSADRAGGIVGFCLGNISNITMTNSTIETTGGNSQAGGIAGLINLPEIIISNCSLDNVIVKSVNGYAGGIAGFARNAINLCSVINSTITALGDSSNGIGGIVGFGDTGTSVTEHTIENNTITGANGVGDIIGAPTIVSHEQPEEEVSLISEEPVVDKPELNLNTNSESTPAKVSNKPTTEDKNAFLDSSNKPNIKDESSVDKEDEKQQNTDANKEEANDTESKQPAEETGKTEEKREGSDESKEPAESTKEDKPESNKEAGTEESTKENNDGSTKESNDGSTKESKQEPEQVTE